MDIAELAQAKRPGEEVPLINEEVFAKRLQLDAKVVELVGEEPVLKPHMDINSAEEFKEFTENCDAFICKKLRNTEVVYEKLDDREKLLFDEEMAKGVMNNTEVQKAPVANQITRSLLKLKAVIDEWLMEEADATSASLQTTKSPEELWTREVPELSKALGAEPGEPRRVVGNTHGDTTAPSDFWQDVGRKTEENGGIPIMGDPCTWIFVKEETINDKYPKVCGVSLNHADDFFIMGDHKDKDWMAYREKLKNMYEWGTWQSATFMLKKT